MKLEKVTKLKDLRLRRQKLRQEMSILDQKIKQVGKDLQREGFKAFLTEGTTEAPTNQDLRKLKRRLVFLQGLDSLLDQLLVRTVRHDRQLAISKIKRGIANCEKERRKRYNYYLRLREQTEKIRQEDKVFKEQKIELESQLNTIKRPVKEESLRLNQLESFLKREFLLGDDLRLKVLEARKHNREILEKANPELEDIIYRNFQIKYSLETGQTLSLKLTEQNAKATLGGFDKRKLVREVC